jgi:uncharacterized protein YuzE
MAVPEIAEFLKIAPAVKRTPHRYLWSSYDPETDVLYINFKKPSHATDSEITDDDVIVRYEGEEVIGLTVLHVGQR